MVTRAVEPDPEVIDGDAGSFGSQQPCDRRTYAPSAAGHQRHLAVEVIHNTPEIIDS
jgi:hypothetical protein